VRVLDASGDYVRREPLIGDDVWYDLQKALDASTQRRFGERSKGSPLLQIAFCGYCGKALHQSRANRGNTPDDGNLYYYRCPNRECGRSRAIRREILETLVSETLLDAVGDRETVERMTIPADDHSQELARIGTQISDLTTQRFVYGVVPSDYDERMAALQAEHARISALPKEADQVKETGSGKTFAVRWEEMDTDQRHAFLKRADVTVHLTPDDTEPDDLPSVNLIDTEGRTVIASNGKWRAVVYLGNLASLRKLADRT
jgi:Recombinase zinc beta ribbon domain